MLSGVGPKSHLKRHGIPVLLDLPVGDNYKNHPDMSYGAGFARVPLSVDNLLEVYYNRSGPLSYLTYLMTYISTKSNPDKDWPNAKLNFVDNPFNRSIEYILVEMQRVRSRGTIRLRSISPYIPPIITPNFLSDPRDFQDAMDAIKFAFYVSQLAQVRSFFTQNFIQRAGCQSCPGVEDFLCDSGIECFVRRSTLTSSHAGCSCRMGAVERNDVVVDPCLRVKNARNLRVCDASIFPDLPNANINAAAHMVGEKCADLIKADYFIS